jgi:hypothetical protein
MRPLNVRFRLGATSPKGPWLASFRALSLGSVAVTAIVACGTATPAPDFTQSTTGGGNSTSTSTHVVTFTSTSTSTLADGGVVVTTNTGTSTVTSTIVSSNTSHTGSTSTSGGTNTTSTSTTASNGADAGDGGFTCTNTDMTKINIDSSGWICNNQWTIEGAWYCYADKNGSNDQGCQTTGVIPYSTTSSAMCISGKTSNVTSDPANTFGAGLGFVLNQTVHGATDKPAYNAKSHNIVGFAITVTGNTGGSVLNINFPMTNTVNKEAPSVTVPGVSGSSMTYNVLIGNAIAGDSTTVPAIDPTTITSVEAVIPGGDGIVHNYNYCVTSVVPLTAAPAAPSSLSAYGPSFNEGKQIWVSGLGPYAVQNDPTNVATDPMSMTVSWGGGNVGFTASPTFGDTGNSPGAFPSVVSGWIHNGYAVSAASGGYAGNKTINGLSSVKSNWSWSAASVNKWDAAYDAWFAQNSSPLPINAGVELMVWLGHGSSTNPIMNTGGPTAVTIGGTAFSVYTGTVNDSNGQHPVISYLANSTMTSVSNFDLLPIFKDASSHGLPGTDSLLSVQAGFELYQAGTWTTSSYSINIQ